MAASDQPLHTIRLSQRDKERLIEKINSRSRPVPAHKDQRKLRVTLPFQEIVVTIWHADGRSITYTVIPRNLSAGGLAFIHGQFLHPESLCNVQMPTHNGERTIKGKVLACRHLAGLIHEIAVKFDQPIELADFVEFNTEQALQDHKEKRDDGALGQALVIDDSEPDLRLYAHWMTKFGFAATKAYSASEALGMLSRSANIDVVIYNIQQASEENLAFIKALRDQYRSSAYVIATSPEDDLQVENQATEVGCDTFLTKPFDETTLRNMIVEGLLGGAGQSKRGPIYSTLSEDQEMRPLIKEFVESLEDFAAQLDHAVRSNDVTFAAQLCRQLKGAGGSYGFDSITLSAQMAMCLLQDDTPKMDAIKRSVDELIAVIRSARS